MRNPSFYAQKFSSCPKKIWEEEFFRDTHPVTNVTLELYELNGQYR